jgi:hypothetical protein
MSVLVRYTEDGNTEAFSPWDARLVGRDKETDPFFSLPLNNHLPAQVVDDLSRALAHLTKKHPERCTPFEGAVKGDTVVPDYGREIPLPMELDLIKCRLDFGYYRRLAALDADVDPVLDNCLQFNGETAALSNAATSLHAKLKDVIECVRRTHRRALQPLQDGRLEAVASGKRPARGKAPAARHEEDEEDEDEDEEAELDEQVDSLCRSSRNGKGKAPHRGAVRSSYFHAAKGALARQTANWRLLLRAATGFVSSSSSSCSSLLPPSPAGGRSLNRASPSDDGVTR